MYKIVLTLKKNVLLNKRNYFKLFDKVQLKFAGVSIELFEH